MTSAERQRLARAVTERRLFLGLSQEDLAARSHGPGETSALNRRTVYTVEQGEPVRRRTLWKLDHGLQWRPGSCENLLIYGEDPTPIDGGAASEAPTPDLTDDTERAIWALPNLTDDERQEFLRLKRERDPGRQAADPKPLVHIA